MAVVMRSSIFWDINPLKDNRRFGGTCSLHIQGARINQVTIQRESRQQEKLCSQFLEKDTTSMFRVEKYARTPSQQEVNSKVSSLLVWFTILT
jgi:hypothetical protein